MGKDCCEAKTEELGQLKERQASVLKTVMAINLIMFVVEFYSGWRAKSTALTADSLDMLGDAIVYAFSLYVLHKSNHWRATAALLKGLIIVAFGVVVLIQVGVKLMAHSIPAFETMGVIGTIALAANAFCLYLLTRHRDDDINMRSTWICSRNDIISNTGVLVAAGLVSALHSKWPDIIVGLAIAVLFLRSAFPILIESIQVLSKKPLDLKS